VFDFKLDYNFHSHTSRCGHAKGTDEEYVQAAIKAGIKYLGFSDHIFFPGISQPGIRGEFSELKDYINSVNQLKEKYKDQIKIFLGFECEYFPHFNNYYEVLTKTYKFDFLILGQHLIDPNDHSLDFIADADSTGTDAFDRYYDFIEKGINKGFFNYLCHPDLFCKTSSTFTPQMAELSHKICSLCEKKKIPIELNLHGLLWKTKDHMDYVNENFIKIASNYKLKFMIGIDAHNPDEYSKNKLDFAKYLIKKYHLKMLKPKKFIRSFQ